VRNAKRMKQARERTPDRRDVQAAGCRPCSSGMSSKGQEGKRSGPAATSKTSSASENLRAVFTGSTTSPTTRCWYRRAIFDVGPYATAGGGYFRRHFSVPAHAAAAMDGYRVDGRMASTASLCAAKGDSQIVMGGCRLSHSGGNAAPTRRHCSAWSDIPGRDAQAGGCTTSWSRTAGTARCSPEPMFLTRSRLDLSWRHREAAATRSRRARHGERRGRAFSGRPGRPRPRWNGSAGPRNRGREARRWRSRRASVVVLLPDYIAQGGLAAVLPVSTTPPSDVDASQSEGGLARYLRSRTTAGRHLPDGGRAAADAPKDTGRRLGWISCEGFHAARGHRGGRAIRSNARRHRARTRLVNAGDLKKIACWLPKTTRAEPSKRVGWRSAFGDLKTMNGQVMLRADRAMLGRGTANGPARQIDDELTRLKVTGDM